MKSLVMIGSLLKDAAVGWSEHRAQKMGAALAFYTTFSLAPLTLVAIAITGYFFGEEAARGGIVNQIEHLVGRNGAHAIEVLIQNASEPQQSKLAMALSIGLLLFAATSVFAELKDSLDTIWEVKRKPGLGVWLMIKTQALSFLVVLGTGFLLLVSLLLTAILTAFTNWIGQSLPVTIGMASLLDFVVSFIVITLLFAMIFKLLPDVTVQWKDVWIGAVSTSMLFMLGKYLIGLYIGRASIGSIYGAAGSLVVILMWTYYSSQILFFGAELTRAYATQADREQIVPNEHAVPITKVELAKQGMTKVEESCREASHSRTS